ncbi:MAG: hypothetical protein EOM69_00270 [Clostridia bacterium]|nr:hypothetical protein [Clostridia bacterium]
MTLLLVGALAFALFFASDCAQLRRCPGTVLFSLGGVLLCGATLPLLFSVKRDLFAILCAAAALGFLALLLYTLFFALPKNAYTDGRPALVDRGVYALCRHPGVLWLGGFYLCLWGVCRTQDALIAFLWFTLLDVAYAAWQDRFVFSRTIAGYSAYRARIPFLLPTVRSIRLSIRRPDDREV